MWNLGGISIAAAAIITAYVIAFTWPDDHVGFKVPPQIITIHEFTPAPPAVCPAPPVKRHSRH